MSFEFDASYFLYSNASIMDNPNLREPQKYAYIHTYNHFVKEAKTNDAVLLLPPGVGKTGLMGILPYMISKGRVLIITPQLTIRDVVTSELNPDNPENFWISKKVFENPSELPAVIEYEMDTNLEVLQAANIVILNVHKLQVRLESSLLNKVSEDFFDMIIIDEAHHSVANTWIDAMHYFSDAKVIKLTGTPIRPDKKPIFGDLIYRYSLAQAMSKGYVKSLRNFNHIPEEATFSIDDSEDKLTYDQIKDLKDEEWISRSVALSPGCSLSVIRKSIELLNQKLQNSTVPHKIIAVACNINHAKLIKELYDSEGCTSTIIHSAMQKYEIDAAKLVFIVK